MSTLPLTPSRIEVMNFIGKDIESDITNYLNPIEENWQASELLPLTSDATFVEDLKSIQEMAQNHSYDLMAVLVADTITEEALPTYETWLAGVTGVDQYNNNLYKRTFVFTYFFLRFGFKLSCK
jgi:acyl-[acyl-carrier-protein] desaturase